MQNFTYVDEDTSVKASLYALIDNQASVASNFAGAAFPTTNLILNQTCFRTDEQKLYRLTARGPDVWTLENDLTAPMPINVASMPGTRPSLALDFINGPKRLPGRVKFTRASVATYIDSKGKLAVAAANMPRFDHDPVTQQRLGLLIEEARTNLLLQSNDLSKAAWGKSNCTAVASAMTGPDGTMSACRVDRGANGNHYVWQQIPVTAPGGKTYTFSMWIMAGSMGGGVKLMVKDGGGGNVGTSADFQFPAPGTWARLSFTYTMPAGAADNVGFFIDPSKDTGGAGDSFYVYGAQVEEGATLSSYIPTTTAQVTRAADAAYLDYGDWGSVDGVGTIYCEAQCTVDANVEPHLWQIRNTSNELVQVSAMTASQTVKMDCYLYSQYQATLTTGGTLTGPVRTAFAWASNSFAGSVNGGSVVTDNAGSVPVFNSTAQLWLGRDYSTSRYLNGYVRALRYYPKRLANAELQALTT